MNRTTLILILGWGALLGLMEVARFVPASWWLHVPEGAEGVHVYDVEAGHCPRIDVVRTIYRPFQAEWVVTLRKRDQFGAYVFVDSWTDRNEYNPDSALSPDIDLAWWANIPHCDFLEPGSYQIVTSWSIKPHRSRFIRLVRNTSNTFMVLEKGEVPL